jgi:NAD(P)-dependent dehydrogenase (short-subunit alcohol dehydrogenase family)
VNDIGVSADANRYSAADGAAPEVASDAERVDIAQQVAEDIVANGGAAVANRADVSDPDGARSIVESALNAFGRIDIVINNAGVVITNPLPQLTDADLAVTHAVHVLGSVNVTRAAWPHLRAQHYGRIVTISSVEGGLIGSAGFEAYASAKGALIGLTKQLALLGRSHGITANAVLPGGRTRASQRSGRQRSDGVDRSAAAVAPPVAWLSHAECAVSGELFAVSAASVRRVFQSIAAGHRSTDGGPLSVDDIAAAWSTIQERAQPVVPVDLPEFEQLWDGARHAVSMGRTTP